MINKSQKGTEIVSTDAKDHNEWSSNEYPQAGKMELGNDYSVCTGL